MILKNKIYIIGILFCLAISGCKYSLSGYEITAETASVSYFQNQAPIQTADLSQIFSNKLELKIIRETPLKLVQDQGQVQFSGAITGYTIRPVAVQNTENTAQSELSIAVSVEYINSLDEEKDFSQSFRAAETFDANQDLSSIEAQLLDSITDQLVEAIFNRAFINW